MYFYASFADRLGVDFRYTFNFSKPEDKHVTHINLQSKPRHDDRDVELTITCYEPARLNLTLYSSNLQHYLIVACRFLCLMAIPAILFLKVYDLKFFFHEVILMEEIVKFFL